MGIVIRRSGYTAILSYLGFFIGYVNMLWLFPFVFSPEEIGLIRLLLAVAALLSTFFLFGGSQIVFKFFPYFSETIQRRSAFLKLLMSLASAGTLLLIVGFICFRSNIIDIYSPKSPLLVPFLWYVLPLTSSLLFYGVIEAHIIVQGFPIVPTLMREVYTRGLLTVASLLFFAAWISFSGFVGIVSFLYCLTPVVLYAYGHSKRLVPINGTMKEIRKKEIIEISQFGFFAFLGNTGAALLANIDSIILSAYSGLVNTGIYGIALFIAVIIEIPKRSLSQVLIPMVVKANKENDVKVLGVLYKKSSINQLLIGTLIFLLIWLNIDGLFSLIPHGDIYREGKWVVFWIGLAKLFDMSTGINAEIIGTSRYYRMDLLFFSIVSIIGVSLNFILIPQYGILGAAMAVFVSTVSYNIIRFVFIAVAMEIQPFSGKTLIGVICALLTFEVLSFVPSFNGTFADICFRTILIGIIFGGLILSLNVSDDISQTVRKIVARLNPFH